MVFTFDDADAADRHATQYFEMFVNRGIYHQGWTAVTRHSLPWDMNCRCPPSMTTSGRSTHPTIGRKLAISRRSSPRSRRSCRACSCSRPPNTTCSRSTTAVSNDSTRTLPVGRHSLKATLGRQAGSKRQAKQSRCTVDGKKAGEERVDSTEPMTFSAGETTDVDDRRVVTRRLKNVILRSTATKDLLFWLRKSRSCAIAQDDSGWCFSACLRGTWREACTWPGSDCPAARCPRGLLRPTTDWRRGTTECC